MILHINNSLRNAAHTGSHIGNNAVADGKDVEHNVHAVTHQGFGCHKANEVMHGSLRAFEFMEVGSVFEQRYGKEQYDQRITDADHRIVQALHYAPYCPALKSLGGWLLPAPQSSVSLSFQVEKALFRFSTIQFWFKISPTFG